MSEQATDQQVIADTTNSQRRTWARPAYLVLPLIVVLIALGLYLFFSPGSGTVQVKGPLSAGDVQVIRHELRRQQGISASIALRHGKFDLLWKELWIFSHGSLVSLDSSDGKVAVAKFRGRDWSRNGFEFHITLTNSAGAWSFAGMEAYRTAPTKQ